MSVFAMMQMAAAATSTTKKACFECGETTHVKPRCSVFRTALCTRSPCTIGAKCWYAHRASELRKYCGACGWTHVKGSCSADAKAAVPTKRVPVCYECGTAGHTWRNCWKNHECERCGEVGHFPQYCNTPLKMTTWTTVVGMGSGNQS